NSSGVASSTGGRDPAPRDPPPKLPTPPPGGAQGGPVDSGPSNPRHFFFPPGAMSGEGGTAPGAPAAGAGGGVSRPGGGGAARAGRYSGDALNTIQAPTTAQTSSTSYTLLGSGRNRWGDYSSTVIDPSDDMTMWSFQEYCNATNSWAVRVLKLAAPPPATP